MERSSEGDVRPRKVFLFMMTSLDGYFEGPNHELDWHNTDEEFDKFTIEQLQQIDTILFGRRTYEMMAEFWTSSHAKEVDPIVADFMNGLPKIVFSRTLNEVGWTNAWLAKRGVSEEVEELKRQPGKEIAVFGSSNLSTEMAEKGLLDEFRIMLNPVILGKGHPFLGGIGVRQKLKVKGVRQFQSGNILITYVPR